MTKTADNSFNLCRFILEKQLKTNPNATALEVLQGKEDTKAPLLQSSWSFADLDHAVRAIANGLLNEGVEPGDFLLLRLTSDTPFALTYLGAITAGIVPVLLSPLLSVKEVAFFIKDTGAKHIAWSPSLPIPETNGITLIKEQAIINFIEQTPLADYAETKENDPAFLIYTSGTTSQPKGVLHAQRTIKGRIPMRDGWHQMKAGDRVLHAGDFNWTYTLGIGLLDPWMWGATSLIFRGKKTPALWPELIRQHKPTIFAAVPGVFRQILKHAPPQKDDLTTLRYCLSAGETLPADLHQQWKQVTGKSIYEALGQSEISTYVSTAEGLNIPDSAMGRIQKGRKVVILPEEDTNDEIATKPLGPNQQGLIAVHNTDPGLMLHYWQRPDEMQNCFRGEWFISGDSGTIDEHQNLTHHGRIDDIMNAGGYRVSPLEVESALLSSELISEAAVTTIEVRKDVSIITAYIVLKEDTTASPLDETTREHLTSKLKEHLETSLASYKRPKSFIFTNQLPRNKTGKILRNQLHLLLNPAQNSE